ncbi:molybdenum cofactor biosynthesis protein [Kordiimonas sediminis]|uniref:Molybdenum cofactor biosynthesis protein n=1 Tax=Kordiimonas sediminis TaxID=1735581 RepID=A0A919AVA2_9PROT|nr:molybdopterin-binding protein [Kordiimonas sediminis]GHF24866.1 molybdenum cofactor biosynthesis protein [Kordiimonas sediminis]
MTIVTAAILVIGDEILSGRTQDTNTNYIARWLNEIGIDLMEARVVTDVEADIVAALNALRARYTYVFTTGGIGPTHDDITAEAVAAVFGVPLGVDKEAYRRLEAHYGAADFTPARQRMARVPEGGILIDNPVSIAPGFQVGNVFVMAGVPKIMQAMLEHIRDRLQGGQTMLSNAVTIMAPESKMAGAIGDIQAANPNTAIGSYPFMEAQRFGCQIVVRARTQADIDKAIASVVAYADGEQFDYEKN